MKYMNADVQRTPATAAWVQMSKLLGVSETCLHEVESAYDNVLQPSILNSPAIQLFVGRATEVEIT